VLEVGAGVADSVVRGGPVVEGAVVEGTVVVGSVVDGTVEVGTVVEGRVVDGRVVEVGVGGIDDVGVNTPHVMVGRSEGNSTVDAVEGTVGTVGTVDTDVTAGAVGLPASSAVQPVMAMPVATSSTAPRNRAARRVPVRRTDAE